MAVPKRKRSKQKIRQRTAQQKIKKPALTECSNCKSTVPSHSICPVCGYYKGKQRVTIAGDKEK